MTAQWIYYKYYVDDGYVRAQTRVNLIFCVCFSLPVWPTVHRQCLSFVMMVGVPFKVVLKI